MKTTVNNADHLSESTVNARTGDFRVTLRLVATLLEVVIAVTLCDLAIAHSDDRDDEARFDTLH